MLEEKDLAAYYARFNIRKDEAKNEQALAQELEGKTTLGRRK